MGNSDQGKRSLGSRLLHAVTPRFRSRSRSRPQLGTDEANAPMPGLQRDGAASSAQAPPKIDNAYAAIVGLPTTTVDPTVGSLVYEGLKTVLQVLCDCSDMFLPLKTATGGLLAVFKIVDVRGSEVWFHELLFNELFLRARRYQGTKRNSKISRQS
jgi:hypothetical protein